jgi:hypothetical protein
VLDIVSELVGEFVLRFDRTQNRLLPLVELPQPAHAPRESGNLLSSRPLVWRADSA